MRISKDFWLNSKPIAHRGLWNNKIIENSLTAYQNAVDNGYPIEIDLYSSTDGVLYSFHDKTLYRMTGKEGNIFDKTSEEINSYRLNNSNEKIPTFLEILKLCENKVPLLIEIKNQPDKLIVERIVNILKDYKGQFAIQSFNPLYLIKLKKLAPEFLRGILATNNKDDLKEEKPFTRFVIKHMALNFIVKPDFISYYFLGYPLKKIKTKNKTLLAWTITNQKDYKQISNKVNNIIFENFIPKE